MLSLQEVPLKILISLEVENDHAIWLLASHTISSYRFDIRRKIACFRTEILMRWLGARDPEKGQHSLFVFMYPPPGSRTRVVFLYYTTGRIRQNVILSGEQLV